MIADVATVCGGKRNFLSPAEVERLLVAARKGRNGTRDHCLILLAYRHGLRVSELVDIRTSDLDIEGARIFCRRLKNGLSTTQPLDGDELRAIRATLRARATPNSPFLFLGQRGPLTRGACTYLFAAIGKRAGLEIHVHPHMLRHSCGYYLANKGVDSRVVQDLLGHRNANMTALYTRTATRRFEGLWR